MPSTSCLTRHDSVLDDLALRDALEEQPRGGARRIYATRGAATYRDVYKLTYVRGLSGIIVMLAEELKKG